MTRLFLFKDCIKITFFSGIPSLFFTIIPPNKNLLTNQSVVDMVNMVKIESSDGKIFDVSNDIANKSALLKNLLEGMFFIFLFG